MDEVDRAVRAQVPPEQLRQRLELARTLADSPATLEQSGSGWGALEVRRRAVQGEAAFPAGFDFPTKALGSQQAPWLALLDGLDFPEQDTQSAPPSYLVDPVWLALLEHQVTRYPVSWMVWLLLGVARLENGQPDTARAAWEASLLAMDNAWAMRNLAVLDEREGQTGAALRHYHRAQSLLSSPVPALTEEYLATLIQAGDWKAAATCVRDLTPVERQRDRILLLSAHVQLEMDELGIVEETLHHDFAVIREGETVLSQLWFGLYARKLAAQSGRQWQDVTAQEVQVTFPLPVRLNFIMNTASHSKG